MYSSSHSPKLNLLPTKVAWMKFSFLLFVVCFSMVAHGAEPIAVIDRIRPSEANPFYWQYQGENVLLLGGSVDDNLFQLPELKKHLDQIRSVGGNYIRNTMSDRHDKGFEVYPFHQLKNGKYDLDQWNPEYWIRFENMLKWTGERDIIVQIEVWDRFDYSTNKWPPHPYNPVNNINYTKQQSGLAEKYPRHPGANQQPFFFTTAKQKNNKSVLKYQQKFVEKMLSHSLKYGHVLYCIDNETNGEEAWSTYWAEFIRERSKKTNQPVCITEMWDDWNLSGPHHRRTIDHPERYDFIDVSQNNHQKREKHWDNFQALRKRLMKKPRPINTVKTYGADGNKFGHSSQDGIGRFWRHVIGGAASARFHRPDAGLGFSSKAIAAINAARKLESAIKLWDVEPANHLLSDRDSNEAYLAANPGKAYAIYFPQGGSVKIDLSEAKGKLTLKWINIETGDWGTSSKINSGKKQKLKTPDNGNWAATITR